MKSSALSFKKLRQGHF